MKDLEVQRPWFFKKNGEIGYVYNSPFITPKKSTRKQKTQTVAGSLQNTGFDMSKSSKKARELNRK